jgi:hypothetical protein
MSEIFHRFIDFVSSLKLTIICLAAAIILVFAGTLAQVNFGIHEVQQRYFQSLFVWWPAVPHGWRIPVFPGGHLLGGVLLVNLIAAHIRRFQWTWRKLGIQLTHAGLIIMLAGGLFTDLFSVSSYMRLAPGQTKNYSEDSISMELAVIDESDKDLDQVTAIPDTLLKRGGTIEHSSLPFRIIVRQFYQNSQLEPLDKAGPNALPAATQDVGSGVVVSQLPPATAENERDVESAVVEIAPIPAAGEVTAQSLGTWLVSDQLGAPQRFTCAGKTWRLELRPERYYQPYSLTLRKFTHDLYAGTDIPKNFASSVALTNPDQKEDRDVLIYMNHPLRYQGETYYQSGFEKNDAATILEVVHNPTFVAPYIACVVVAAGLLFQFLYHFVRFSRRSAPATPPPIPAL